MAKQKIENESKAEKFKRIGNFRLNKARLRIESLKAN